MAAGAARPVPWHPRLGRARGQRERAAVRRQPAGADHPRVGLGRFAGGRRAGLPAGQRRGRQPPAGRDAGRLARGGDRLRRAAHGGRHRPGRQGRARHGVRQRDQVDRPGRVADLGARPHRRHLRQRRRAAGRARLGHRAGLRPDQHEPVHHQGAVLPHPAGTRRPGLLPPGRHGGLGAQHAGAELPLAVRVGDLGGQPRRARPDDLLLQPVATGGVLRPRREGRRGLARRRRDPDDREQLRDPAHHRHLRADPRQAPYVHPVPAQVGPVPGREERRRLTGDQGR